MTLACLTGQKTGNLDCDQLSDPYDTIQRQDTHLYFLR